MTVSNGGSGTSGQNGQRLGGSNGGSGTSGQNGQKSGGGKFRQESDVPRPSGRLRQDKTASKAQKRFEKSGQRVAKTSAKLDKARKVLSKKKNPGIVKKLAQNVRKPVKAAKGQARHEVWAYTHQKIHEVERDNVGVEAAHRAELAGEKVVRAGERYIKQRIKTHPARRVRKLEKKSIRARAEHELRRITRENPQLKSNPISRRFQKQRLRSSTESK